MLHFQDRSDLNAIYDKWRFNRKVLQSNTFIFLEFLLVNDLIDVKKLKDFIDVNMGEKNV